MPKPVLIAFISENANKMSCSLCTFPACPAVPCPTPDCGQNFCCQDHLNRWVGLLVTTSRCQNCRWKEGLVSKIFDHILKNFRCQDHFNKWVGLLVARFGRAMNDGSIDRKDGVKFWILNRVQNHRNIHSYSAFNGQCFLSFWISGCQMIVVRCRHRGRDDTCPPYLVHSDPVAGR